jgi:hypothetical protein
MTFVEFIHPLRNRTQPAQVVATLYYLLHHEGQESATPNDIKGVLIAAGVPSARKMNTSAALKRSIPNVHSISGGRWEITDTGQKHVRQLLALPEPDSAPQTTHDVSTLQAVADRQTDEAVKDYIEEAIRCLSAGALRAAVVFLWSGAVHTIRERMWSDSSIKEIDTAFKKFNQRAKFGKKGDFGYVNDALLIDAAVELEVVDRSEKKRLVEALDLRNDCGHPVKFKPGPNKVRAYIEDVAGIVFP